MTKLLLLSAALAACTQQEAPTALHELGSTTVEVVANGQVNIELKVESIGCPLIGEDVVATFDGHPMHVARGGRDEVSDGCYPIAFWISPRDIDGIITYEQGASSSEVVIEDASARWSVGSTRLFGNTFTIDAAKSTVTWQEVSQVTSAQLNPSVPVTISGNVISYPPGTDVVSVDAYAHPKPTRCEGPGTCLVDLSGARNFKGNAP